MRPPRRVRVLLLAVGIVFLVPPAASARRVHLTCIDGCPRGRDSASDVDGPRDGVCTFALCASRASCLAPVPCPCARPLSAAVPLGKSVLKTPDVTFVLRCRRAGEIACSVTTTTTSTTTTTLAPSPSHLTTPSFTLSVMGCQAVIPLLANATVILGTFN